jgi:spore germination protein
MEMINRLKCFIIVSMLLPLITGCWDRIEIEQRGFVVGLAIDYPKSKEAEERTEKETEEKANGKKRFVMTLQMVVPSKLQQGGGKGGSGGGEAYFNISSEGESLFEIVREMAAKTSRTPFFEHIELIIVSDAVAKEGQFSKVMDFFIRHPEMRRGTKVLIARGEARKLLEVEPKNESLPVLYINSISRNNYKNARMLPISRIGDIHEHLLKHESFTIQRISGDDREVKIAGNAVFHGHTNKLIGFLGEEETEGYNFVTGEIKGGILKVPVKDSLVVYDIKQASHSMEANVDDIHRIKFTINIESKGQIVESFEQMDYLDPNFIKTIEEKAAKEIEGLANDAITKLQKDFKVDAIGLGNYLSNEHPDLWEKIKNDWDRGENYFIKSVIEVKAEVSIYSSGTINRSEQ